MKKKSNKASLIVCACAFVFTVVYLAVFDNGIFNSLGKIKFGYLLIAIAFMGIYWLLEAASLHVVTKSVHPEQKFKHTFLVSILGQYYNCITPFASGGQPIQAYYMVRYGTPLGSSMTALLAKFIVYQFVLTLYSAVVLVCGSLTFVGSAEMLVLTIIGFVINFAVIIGLLVLAFAKKAAVRIAHGIIALLAKIRIVKDKDAKIKFIDEEMDAYHKDFIFIKQQPIVVLKMVIMTVLQLTVYFSISYVLYLGFGLSGTSWFTIISCQAYVLMISAFVPLPGALGAAEGSYAAFYSGIFGSYVGISTFIWRFLTFYLPIIIGLVTTLCMNRHEKKKMIATEADE